MTHYYIQKSSLKGHITVPSSKSHTLRAILFAALASGRSVIHHYLPSEDTLKMIEACRLFGATVEMTNEQLVVHGIGGVIKQCEDVIHAGNSGIILRFCTALGALASNPVVTTGDSSIRHHRPMHELLSGLEQLGVSAKSMRGDHLAPVIIQGPITGDRAIISGEDSQPVSALLIAAAFADHPIELLVNNPGEKPWVGLTLDWFARLGIPYANRDFCHYSMQGNARYPGFEYTVPGDISSAAFPLAAALITKSELVLKNIDLNDPQGDKELISVFIKMGACIDYDATRQLLHVKAGNQLHGISVDINNFIDAVTILAVVACYAEGETHIYNAAIAKQKECNRLECIAAELKKMGADITLLDDGLLIRNSPLSGCEVKSYDDHRMAMSLAVAGLGANGITKVSSIACIAKTFPTFMRDFNWIGANIKESKT